VIGSDPAVPVSARDSTRQLARAGALLVVAGLISRILGWIRVLVITDIFGASLELDAYFAAFRIPDALLQLVAGGVLSSVLIPLIADSRQRDEVRVWVLIRTISVILLGALLALVAVAFVTVPLLVPLIAPGFTDPQREITGDLTRVMLASPLCFAVGAVAASVLNSESRFRAAALAPIAYNVAIILGAVLLSPALGIFGVAVGVAVGAFLFLSVQLVPLLHHRVMTTPLTVDLKDRRAWQALRQLAPRSFGLAGSQAVFIVNTALASLLGTGAVTVYNLAFTILQVPIALLGLPLGMVVFPSLARAVARGAHVEYRALLHRSLRFVAWGAALLTVIAIVGREEIVELLFGHGALDREALEALAAVVLAFMLGLGAHSLNLVLARAFYALHDTRTPVLATLGQVALSIAIALAASPVLGVSGLAIAIAAGSWAKALTLFVLLATRHAALDLASVVRPATAVVMPALGAFVAAYAADGLMLGVSASWPPTVAAAAGLITVAVAATSAHLLASQALGLPEGRRLYGMAASLRRGAGA